VSIVFVDTLYLVAIYNRKDQWHDRALAVGKSLTQAKLITTEEVLIELLNFFSEHGEKARRGVVAQVEGIFSEADIEVVLQHHDTFVAGLALYKARPDKGYSLTDCISMNVMRERGINEILTHDDHFTQEGFKALL
jgi:predicted nucleic acid-binding protein